VVEALFENKVVAGLDVVVDEVVFVCA